MKKNSFHGDICIPVTVFALSVFGVIAVYSASNYVAKADYGNEFYFAVKQAVGVITGIVAMTVTANVDYHKYFGKCKWAYLSGLVLLALCFVPFLSVEVYGAKRWINLGFFTLQPSEIAKFSYVFFVAEYFAVDPSRARSFKGVLVPIISGIILCLLIVIEPNMSITVCVGAVMLSMLFLAGMKIKHFTVILLPLLALIPVLIVVEPYRLRRFTAFLNPWENPKGEGYQLLQSLYGLGSGGLFGVGLFNSRQKFRYLPFSESDFILSVIGEETGFFGTCLLFSAMIFLITRGIKTAKNSKDFYGYLLSSGITVTYAVQVAVNALVVTGSIPPTGLPLPLISSGNTSVTVFFACFGVLYNVSKNSASDKIVLTAPEKSRERKFFSTLKPFRIE